MNTIFLRAAPAAASLLLACASAMAQAPTAPITSTASPAAPNYADSDALGVAMEGWAYPYPLQTLQFELQGQPVRMMYMDVQPANPNGKTALLFHGKNFGSDY